ncbi:hypothetical protein JAAARDRAFT_196432 [Jaapia argillacea MUCL 33604]|uniref:C2 domain-containing protein n=1 Tax=Jaapia argillacea MUCL 33604 TaxID=933084 RepID=A0A067PIB4_9AGAM|nr:hypothetical protein JAAARDRAFT_196432 [Jaapia argillacea MUCL 33604]
MSHYQLNIDITDLSIQSLTPPVGSITLNSFLVFRVGGEDQQLSSLKAGRGPSWPGEIVTELQDLEIVVFNKGRVTTRKNESIKISWQVLVGSVRAGSMSAPREIKRTLGKHLIGGGSMIKFSIAGVELGHDAHVHFFKQNSMSESLAVVADDKGREDHARRLTTGRSLPAGLMNHFQFPPDLLHPHPSSAPEMKVSLDQDPPAYQ